MTAPRSPLALALAAALLLGGCQSQPAAQSDCPPEKEHEHASPWAGIDDAVCVITPTEGNKAHGVVRFSARDGKVNVVADVDGLTPGAKHGFHIHQLGDITAKDGTSTGGHYNPEGHQHAGPMAGMRHAGDLGNLSADEKGHAHLELTMDNITVAGAKNPIVGRGMVVHAGTDDLKSQPTGGAGARIGVGVIGIAKGK
ncbi:MAG: superoxide dismutase family protein [Planctomycetota bacterium]